MQTITVRGPRAVRVLALLTAVALIAWPAAAARAATTPSSPSPSPSPSKSGAAASNSSASSVDPTDPAQNPHNPGSWWVQPAPKPGDANARQYFILEGKPGQTLTDGLALSNFTDHPIDFDVYGADGYNTPKDGAFALRAQGFPMTGVGSWVRPAYPNVTVPARTITVVPVTITIPAGATPGDHIGGISGMDTAVEAVQQQGNVRIGIKRVVAARLYLHVDGAAIGALTVSNLRVSAPSPFPAYLSDANGSVDATITNTGNLLLTPTAHVVVTGMFGKLYDKTVTLPQILPGQSFDFSSAWTHVPPFEIGTARIDLSDGTASPPVATSASVSYTAIPWYSLLILLAVAALVVAGLVYRRRRARP